ncbi:MAG: transporter substrate-binding domain-containing protein [Bacilli bacterium]|nr:transporter substrate-binding domain-containing protein [Bacilli bacterium]MBN2876898.1 transporter substrate-binding domain-containing protein [Bacilli bacterium]
MRKVLLGFMAVMSLFFMISCSNNDNMPVDEDTYAAIVDRGYIVVGMECAYAPFNWTVSESSAFAGAVPIDGTSNYADGYDVMIAQEIADGLGVDLVIRAVTWDGLIPSLAETGEIDLIIAGMSPTAERAQTVAFSDSYYQSTHVVVLRSDSEFASATSIEDFSGASVVAQLSTIYDDLVGQMTGATHENPLEDVPTIITAINAGTYDATILELPVAIAVTQANPELTYIEFTEGNGFDVSYEDAAVSVALRQADTTLLSEVNAILATISTETRESLMLDAISRQP